MKRTAFYLDFRDSSGLTKWSEIITLLFEELESIREKSAIYKEVQKHNTTFKEIADSVIKTAKENPDNEFYQVFIYSRPVVITQSKKDIELIEDFIRRHKLEKYSKIL